MLFRSIDIDKANLIFRTWMLSTMLSFCIAFGFNATAGAAESGSKIESETASNKSNFPYQRLDFLVKANCVTCLRKVAKALKATRGVLNADVSIYNPHWAVVIIDTALTDEKKVIAKVEKEKASIDKLFKQDLKDKPIIVVPRSDAPTRL